MYKLFLTLFFLTSINLMSQDTLSNKLDTNINYQYRIIFTEISGRESYVVENMTNFFRTKIDYVKDLNQYIFITGKDVDQQQFYEFFTEKLLLFKKIKIDHITTN